jgi:ribosomal protein L11 methylase PrmA
VLALDNDRESVRAAAANADVNEVEIDVRRLDLHKDPLPRPDSAAAPTVVANLLRPLLLELAASLRGSALEPAQLVAGGLLGHELDEVAAAFAELAGLRERARRREGEWGALWLVG